MVKLNRVLYPILMTAGGAVIGGWVGRKFGRSDPSNFGAVGALLGAAYGARGSILLDMSRGETTTGLATTYGAMAPGAPQGARVRLDDEKLRAMAKVVSPYRFASLKDPEGWREAGERCADRRAEDRDRRREEGDPCWEVDKTIGCAMPGVQYAVSPIQANPDYAACLRANVPEPVRPAGPNIPLLAAVAGAGLVLGMVMK